MDDNQKCLSGYREEYEQEIDLKDLMFHILYRWRSVLVVVMLAGILAASYAVVYNTAILPGKQAEVQGRLEELEQELERQQVQGDGQGSGQVDTQKQEQIKALKEEIEKLQEQLDELVELNPVKYFFIGFAAGFFGMVFLYGIIYMFSDKLRVERELRDRYGYYLLGTFPRQKKKFLSVIDRELEKLEGVSEQITEEETYQIISINIINLMKTSGTCLVTGTVDVEKLQELADVLSRQVEDVTLTVGANMNVTAGTLEMLADCDAVILVEERDKSLRAKIHKEYESIIALAKPVVGYVVM